MFHQRSVSYLERIQVDGAWISEAKFAEMTSQVTDAIARLEEAGRPVPTVFEAETAIAFLYFREMKCDLVVLEAGLGGALDATNIIKNTVCAVFSSISRDHLGVIGNTIEEIAENKAGIIKPGCTVLSAEQLPPVTGILKTRADRMRMLIYPGVSGSGADPAVRSPGHPAFLQRIRPYPHLHGRQLSDRQSDHRA